MSKHPRIILGIADSITSGAAVVIDGRVVSAVNEERLNRVKMAMGWPRLAIDCALRLAGVRPQDVEAVAVATKHLYWRPQAGSIRGYFDAEWGRDKGLALKLGSIGSTIAGDVRIARKGYYAMKRWLTRKRPDAVVEELRSVHNVTAPVQFIDHHEAHAAGAYYTGGKSESIIATLDGAGDNLSATISRGSRGSLERIHAVDSYDSIGNYYSYVTSLLGFKAHQHEGKITGLAAFGKPIYLDLFRSMIEYRDGTMHNKARAFHTAALRKLKASLPSDYEPADVAASVQAILEEVCVAYVAHWVSKTGMRNLAVAGGVVANVKLNQRLLAIPGVESLFIHPGMGDDGLAVGAALMQAAESTPTPQREQFVYEIPDVYLGPGFSDAEARAALDAEGLEYDRPADLAARIADELVQKRVVARCHGKMEYGPRALGNRTIMVHAADQTINDWLNKRLKRTEFMPFAPVTLEEDSDDCYTGLRGAEHTARFMTITTDCTDSLREKCPAVVHVDGTARPQLVGRSENPGYRAILEAYKARTGYSTVINTSFNMHEEPIVCSPSDAVRAFMLGHLDTLILGDFVVHHPDSPPARHEKAGRAMSGAV